MDEIVASLSDMRRDGPVNEDGKPTWPAFDWREKCDIEAVSVFATAGMRLAEQQDGVGSKMLWDMLNEKLSAVVDMEVTTRTLSGYEEGLFAWLAKRRIEGKPGNLPEVTGATRATVLGAVFS